MDDTEIIRDELSKLPKFGALRGEYVGLIDGKHWVDVGGGRIPAALTCPIPQVTAKVHVWFMDGQPFVVGLVTPKATEGAVTTVGVNTVSVTTDTGDYANLPYLVGFTPSSGDIVRILWGETGGIILGQPSDEIVQPPPPPAPGGTGGGLVQLLFTATNSGSAANGSSNWFTNQVHASASNIGIFTYGSKLRDNLRAADVFHTIEVYLTVVRDSGNQPLVGMQPLEDVAGVTPVVSDLTPLNDPLAGWKPLPTTFGPILAAGGGIGFDGAGFTYFGGVPVRGKPGDPQAGALRITFSR